MGAWDHDAGRPSAEQRSELQELWREHGWKGAPALVTSVAGEAATGCLLDALDTLGSRPCVLHPAHGLELAIEHPETVGLDRLYAARGAWQRTGRRDAIVVDAGTALTVDAVRGGRRGISSAERSRRGPSCSPKA
ncbi:MAG: type III pantothenate kinase [Planctomycetota bacterium]